MEGVYHMRITEEQKAELRAEYEKVWHGDAGMVDHCVKQASCVINLRGYLVDYDKPRIETRFCFGEHGYDFDEVVEECDRASRSEAHFMRENMDNTDAKRVIDMLDGTGKCWRKAYPILKPHRYCGQDDDCRIAYIEWTADASKAFNDPMALTDDEKAELRQMMVEEQEKFEKRLKTYLKRYGLSKCRYWTYWADR